MEDTLYTYTRMVFNQLGELGQTLLSFFIGVQSVDSVGRSNSNHQKTLLRFDPRGKSLSSSLFPSELGPGNFRQRGVAINPLPHSTRSISKVFPFSPNPPPFSPLLSVHFPPKGNATRFQIESLALFSSSSSSAILLPFSKVFLPRILLLLGTMHTWKNNRFHHPKLHPLFEFLCSFHDRGSSFPFNNSQIWNSQRSGRDAIATKQTWSKFARENWIKFSRGQERRKKKGKKYYIYALESEVTFINGTLGSRNRAGHGNRVQWFTIMAVTSGGNNGRRIEILLVIDETV